MAQFPSVSDRRSELREVFSHAPRRIIYDALQIPKTSSSYRNFAYNLPTLSSDANNLKAEMLIESSQLETDENLILQDIADSEVILTNIITTELNTLGYLSPRGIKASMLHSHMSLFQSVALCHELPSIKFQEQTYASLKFLANHLADRIQNTHKKLNRNEYIGCAAELITLLSLHRFANKSINTTNNEKSSWYPVPTTIMKDENGFADGLVSNSWAMSVLSEQDLNFHDPSYKIQVKKNPTNDMYARNIALVIASEMMQTNRGHRLGWSQTLRSFSGEDDSNVNMAHREKIVQYLNNIQYYILDKIDLLETQDTTQTK
ncbi:hypothetical protein H6801_03860 [Candidatus Nomurabacteria bacterium]|nr:hypothetical protein [Candidatus Nomurabacteria bacterium]